MKTLTQVWLISAASCFIFLILGFQVGGRLGLLISFLLCLVLLYLIFHRGLHIFIERTRAQEILGNDPYKLAGLFQQHALAYGFRKVRLFVTDRPTPPLVWPEFSNQLVVFLNVQTLEQLTANEKKIFAHLLLSHGFLHSKLTRKTLGLIYISLAPLEKLSAPLFNAIAYAFGLSKEIYKADLKALSVSQASNFEFGLLLHKLHHLQSHNDKIFEGTYFFSILSKINPKLYNLKFHPNVTSREKNLLGYAVGM
ncbi:MAG: hypothetical protein V4654_00085 [Bdellovibrionota bacterium]